MMSSKDKIGLGLIACLVGGAVGGCIMTPIIIEQCTKRITDQLDYIIRGINLGTYATAYPDTIRNVLEEMFTEND